MIAGPYRDKTLPKPMPGVGAEEFKVFYKGILFNQRIVRNEIRWKIRKNYDNIGIWYFHFIVL